MRHVCGSNDFSNVCAKVYDVSRIRVEAMLICLNIYLIQTQILSHDRLSSLLCITFHLFSVMCILISGNMCDVSRYVNATLMATFHMVDSLASL